MKKLSFLLAIALLVSTCSVCLSASAIDPSALAPYEIVWYTLGNEKEDQQAVVDEINKYLTEHYNATLKLNVNTYSDHLTKMQLMASAREPFDLMFVDTQYANYVAQESFYPLTELLGEYGQAMLESYPQNLWDSVTINNEIYAVPTHKYSCSHYYFLVSVTASDAVGVDTSWINADLTKLEKWESFKTWCLEMKQNGGDKNGYVTGLGVGPFNALYPAEGATGNLRDPGVMILGDDSFSGQEHNVVFNQFATPEFEVYCRDAYALAQAGVLPLDPDTKVEMASYKYDPAVAVQDSMAKRLPGYEITYDQDFEAYFINHAFQTTDKIYGSMNAISDTSDDPARTMMLLNALNSDVDFANLVFYGTEGKNWNRNGNGQIEMTSPKTYDLTAWALPGFLTAEPDISLPADMVERYNAFAETLVPADNLGFALDEDSILIELAAIRQVVAEYLDPLTKGLTNPDEYLPKFLSALEAAGVETAIAEMQRQVDAWRALQGYDAP